MCDVSDTEITGNVQIAGTAIDSFQCLSYFDDTCSDSAAQVDDFSVRCGRIDRLMTAEATSFTWMKSRLSLPSSKILMSLLSKSNEEKMERMPV